MANHAPIQEDPKQLENAQTCWVNFMQASKWTIIAITILLLCLTAAFVPFGS